MFLHDVNYEQFDIAHGDTLIDPAHWDDEPFEEIVSNPPYSIKWEGDCNPLLINDARFAPAGVLAPKSKADLAFTMHILSWLAVNGTAAIDEFPGVLYRGGAEREIRNGLLDDEEQRLGLQQEFRIVTVQRDVTDEDAETPIAIRFGDSLKWILIGEHFPESDRSIMLKDMSRHKANAT